MGFKKLAVATLLRGSALSAIAQDRLMPSAEADQVDISFKKDGNALLVYLDNRSKLVVTGALISCAVSKPDVSAPIAKVEEPKPKLTPAQEKTQKEAMWKAIADASDPKKFKEPRYNKIELRYVFVKFEDVRVLPGKQKEGYGETPEDINRCFAKELRGRDKKAY